MVTAKQRRYYFGVVVKKVSEFYSELGWDSETAHLYLKSEYFIDLPEFEKILSEFLEGELGAREVIFKLSCELENSTTTKETSSSFEEKMKKIRTDFDKKGLYIPAPNEPECWLFQYYV